MQTLTLHNLDRRRFLERTTRGLSSLALASLLNNQTAQALGDTVDVRRILRTLCHILLLKRNVSSICFSRVHRLKLICLTTNRR